MANRTGQELGNYRLVSLLGRGGFAEVYLGEHMRLKTKAAIKVLYTQLEGDDTENFLTEAQTVAHLVHPNIVRIFDFDVKEGVPFLVMDYAANGNLRQLHPKNTRISLDIIVSYIKQVADALQYAHDEKLIHRDIKPENMLLGRRNEVLLSDFGIALIAQSTRMQSTQEVVGTAYYMAPEQLQGKPRLASDQYALGIVVYEWLSGNRPFHGSFSEIASQHMFVLPPPLREKVPTISPAIEEVVMTALAKDPRQRFGSVRAFANALEQASNSTRTSSTVAPVSQPPVWPGPPKQSSPQSATPPPPTRSRPPMGKQAEIVHTNTKLTSQTPVTPPRRSESQSNSAMPLNQPASRSVTAAPPRRSESRSSPPQKATTIQPPKQGISRRSALIGLTGAGLVVAGGGITWFVFFQKPQVQFLKSSIGTTLYTYRGHTDLVKAVAWSPSGDRIASASSDQTVQVWDSATGSNLITYRGHSSAINAVVWSSDGNHIASGSDDGTVHIWNASIGNTILTYNNYSGFVLAVAWALNERRMASASSDKTVQVWDAANGEIIRTYRGHTDSVNAVTWSLDGNRIASGSDDHTVQVWDASNGSNLFTYQGHSGAVRAVARSPQEQRIASCGDDGTVQVWDASNGSNLFTYDGHSGSVYGVAWSSDGKHIASCGDDGTVQVWNAANGSSIITYHGHSTSVYGVAWSPDGQYIASASKDQTVQVWQAS